MTAERRTLSISLPAELVDRLTAEPRTRIVGRRFLIERLLELALDQLEPVPGRPIPAEEIPDAFQRLPETDDPAPRPVDLGEIAGRLLAAARAGTNLADLDPRQPTGGIGHTWSST
jgi:hypothetical protein